MQKQAAHGQGCCGKNCRGRNLLSPDKSPKPRVRQNRRRVRESGILDFVEDVFVSEKMDSEKPNRKIFDAALRALGVENREHVLMVGDSLSSDVQGGVNAGLDTCWYNPNHAENPGKVVPTYEISSLEELYPLVMEPEELANVGLKNRRHQL